MVDYRAPRRDEAAALATLSRNAFTEAFGHLYRSEDLSAFLASAYDEAALAQRIDCPRHKIRVADDGGRLVGYCTLAFDIGLDYDPGDKRVMELKQLYIMASHHGVGVAQSMMDWAIDVARAQAMDAIILSVWSGNARGQRFYKRNGFDWIADTYFMVGNQRDDEYLYLRPMS